MAAPPGIERTSAADLMHLAAGHGTFAASSYTGTLYITVLYDPDGMTDAPVLADALRRELPHRDQGPRPANLSALT